MTDEPYIKRELESPTPKRPRLSSQDMYDLMNQYSPPTNTPSPGSTVRRRLQSNVYNNPRWLNERSPRSPAASRRSPYPPGNHLRRSPHHLRRSNRHRDRNQHWQNSQDRELEVNTAAAPL